MFLLATAASIGFDMWREAYPEQWEALKEEAFAVGAKANLSREQMEYAFTQAGTAYEVITMLRGRGFITQGTRQLGKGVKRVLARFKNAGKVKREALKPKIPGSGNPGTSGGKKKQLEEKSSGKGKGLNNNPFKGKTPKQIDKMLKKKGFVTRGPDPVQGKGDYFNPKTGRRYYIDRGGYYKKGREYPHVDVHKKGSNKDKRKYPLGDKLYE